MADIGATLREARTRQRIEISDLESETKIRAKYLRALENEEWDQLPGPAYVKSFLRTYADALGLDGKLLVAEYKLRHERLSDVELQPIAPPGRDRGRRAARGGVPRGLVVAVALAGLVAALYFLGRGTGHSDTASTPPPAAQTTPTASAAARRAKARKAARAKRRKVRLAIVATGQVYVCLTGGGRTLVNGAILTGGARQGPWRARRFRVTLGNGEARLIVNGKARRVPAVTSGIGYEITPPARVKALARARWPSCRA